VPATPSQAGCRWVCAHLATNAARASGQGRTILQTTATVARKYRLNSATEDRTSFRTLFGIYDAVMAANADLLKHPVVSAAIGTAAMAVGAAEAAYRAAERLPVVGSWMRRGVAGLSERGDRWVAQSADQFKALVTAVSVQLVDLVLDEIDLNALIHERVDIDALAADLDIEAVINRIDLIAMADRVIEGVDLPAIIRDSTSSVTAEVMTDVRSQGERADDRMAGIVNRVLGRDREQL